MSMYYSLHVSTRTNLILGSDIAVVEVVNNEKNIIDIVPKCVGTLGRWHVWVCIALSVSRFPLVWHQLSIVFIAPPVNFSCIDYTIHKCSSNCPSHVYDPTTFDETIISQWDLVCDRAYLANLAQTITMLGILFGNVVFGFLSDRFGRRNPLIWAVILQVVSGTYTAYCTSLVVFMVMRFLCAVATGGTLVMSFVLVMELVGPKWRTQVGILYQLPFNLGYLIMPLISYYLRNWKHFQLAISLPSILLLTYYWILPESPRWLLAVGQKEKAIKVLEKAAQINKRPIQNIKSDVVKFVEENNFTEEREGGNILDLVKTPVIRIYTFCIGFNWLVCGLCFFGVAQFIGQLGGNIFINVALSAVIQIPSTLFCLWTLESWGRKCSLIFSNLLAGCSCILIGIIPNDLIWPKAALGCFGMFGISMSLTTVYIYSGELFPTVIRNIGVGTASMCARFGSMAAPFVAGLVSFQMWLPPVIFGVVPIIGAILCLKLPETLDCKLPDTVEEAEEFAKKANLVDEECKSKKHSQEVS